MCAHSQVELLSTVDEADMAAVARLLSQVSLTATVDRERLGEVLRHDATELLVVRVDGQIAAMATFVTVPLLSGLRGHVEDVVVDSEARGRGFARLLLERITELATERGFRTVDLTSRSSRVSALRLYASVGFVRRDTNVLRFVPAGSQ
jgi:ribosomal protein S18 acetylase RimI-like enzyme